MKSDKRRERRNKLEIYYSILNSIMQESQIVDIVRPTRIQFLSYLSYPTLLNHLEDLKEKKLIRLSKGMVLTEKGRQFVQDYEKIQKLIEQIGYTIR